MLLFMIIILRPKVEKLLTYEKKQELKTSIKLFKKTKSRVQLD